MIEPLFELLIDLDGVRQDPRYHPEGDALYHSLQVFQHALNAHPQPNPTLLAAALLHDIGKAIQTPDHAALGADELEGLIHPHTVWLVRHHMDLHHNPKRTRRQLQHDPRLHDLTLLRSWDIAGRNPHAHVLDPRDAIQTLALHQHILQPPKEHA